MNDLQQLLTVSQAQYEQQRGILVGIISEEADLRRELARLTEMATAAEPHDPSFDGLRAIGADLLWQGWVGRARVTLNMRLARLLARKEHEQEKVRRAFGKVVALQELIEAAEGRHHRKKAQQSLSIAIDQSLYPKF